MRCHEFLGRLSYKCPFCNKSFNKVNMLYIHVDTFHKDEIPEGEFFHITHLMEKIKAHGGRVGCFPVSEHAWKDMGEWPEYLKMINVL